MIEAKVMNKGGRPYAPTTVEGRLSEIVTDVQKIVSLSRRKIESQIKLMEKKQAQLEKDQQLSLLDMAKVCEVYSNLPSSITSLIAPLVRVLNDLKQSGKSVDPSETSVDDWKKGLE